LLETETTLDSREFQANARLEIPATTTLRLVPSILWPRPPAVERRHRAGRTRLGVGSSKRTASVCTPSGAPSAA